MLFVRSPKQSVDELMKTFPATDLKQNMGDVLQAASREPVAISRHQKVRYVLMSVEAYNERFRADPRRAYAVSEMPDDHLAMIEGALAETDEF
jgi:prevent-host-death family protein